jgi:hypothetical protein
LSWHKIIKYYRRKHCFTLIPTEIFVLVAVEPVVAVDPCQPNPCGPNSNPPRVVGEQCQCSCLPEMIGSPPNCRPECVINSDCAPDKACINQKCQDPCPGLCGINAACRVRNHVPICVCNPGYIGDPFSSCYLKPSEAIKHFISVAEPTILVWLNIFKHFGFNSCSNLFPFIVFNVVPYYIVGSTFTVF